MSVNTLILGGTRFLGRAIVDAALAAGDRVTLFNRGRTGPELYPDVETVVGDRSVDLSGIAGRHFDVVVDVAAYDPEVVRRSVDALAGRVDRYVFISTVSVYADQSVPQVESAEVLALRDDLDPGELYGARKAVAEKIVTDAFDDRALIVRPGMIVGPHDPTDRFAYWPRRIALGGRVLAPGAPGDPVQFIDVRDLGGWTVRAYGQRLSGVFNATGVPMPFRDLLAACGPAELVWVPTPWLLAAGVEPWMGIPLWIAVPGWEAANAVDVSRAVAAGLTFRPVGEIVADVAAWDNARGGPPAGTEGLTHAEEHRLLTAYLA